MNKLKISKEEFRLLRDFIQESCGILLGDEKDYLIESRLSDLVIRSGCQSFRDFYFKVKNEPHSGLRDKIVDAMTTNETLWFRDKHPFRILNNKILQEYAEQVKRGKRNKIRIWSAGCSTGQEPYSTAMTILEFCRKQITLKQEMFEILATDISSSALFLAINGKYDAVTISRGLPPETCATYFKSNGLVYSIKDTVKKMVTLKKFNLQEDFNRLGHFDVIMCRYVAIYFSDEFKRKLFSKIAHLLNPGGYLFLGASESIRNYCSSFEMLEHNGGLYYLVRSVL